MKKHESRTYGTHDPKPGTNHMCLVCGRWCPPEDDEEKDA